MLPCRTCMPMDMYLRKKNILFNLYWLIDNIYCDIKLYSSANKI